MANDFSTDPNCISVYRFENGALTTDSKGTDTLTAVNAPVANAVNYQEGAASVDLELDSSQCLYRADADLSGDFPMKNGSDNYTMSITCWIKPESIGPGNQRICSKSDVYLGGGAWDLYVTSGGDLTFSVRTDPLGTMLFDWPTGAMIAGNWYFIAVTTEVSGGYVVGTMHIWDLTNNQPLGNGDDQSAESNGEGPPDLSDDPFAIGAVQSNPWAWFYDGLIDELTIWNKVLTRSDIDKIRGGTYGPQPPSKAIDPSPADDATGVSHHTALSWTDGGDADTFDVYLGTDPDDLELVSEDQAGTTYAPSPALLVNETYYWRIDSTNDAGTTTGDVWSFTTELPTPPVVLFTCSAITSVITAKLAPFPAALPIAETLEWNTHIIRGRDGSEQRIAHRGGIPRQGFIYGLFCETEDRGVRLAAMLHKWLKKQWFVPVWPEAEPITVSLASGATTIPVDTRCADYRAGGRALVYGNPEHAQIVRVSAVADDALTLSGGLASAYDGTTWIAPCRLGYVTAAVPGERYGGGASIVQVTYEITDNIAITGHVAALTYDGLEVLTEGAKYFGDSWRESHDADIQIVDAGIGTFKIASGGDFNVTTQDHGWLNDSKSKAWSFRQWLHAIVGRQKSFLVPTLRPDFTLTRTCQAADTSIYVANRGFASNLGVNAMAAYLAFRPAGATIIPRKITGMATISTSEERLDLLTAPGAGFSPGKELCWCHQCRLAKDRVPIDWYERGENTCETQLVRVSQ